jgi:transcription antitermination factor NusG
MKYKIEKYKLVKTLDKEYEVDIPEEPFAWHMWNTTFYMMIPVYTTGKRVPEVEKLKIIKVDDGVIEYKLIYLSDLSKFINYEAKCQIIQNFVETLTDSHRDSYRISVDKFTKKLKEATQRMVERSIFHGIPELTKKFQVGDTVKCLGGGFQGKEGVVQDVDISTVMVHYDTINASGYQYGIYHTDRPDEDSEVIDSIIVIKKGEA